MGVISQQQKNHHLRTEAALATGGGGGEGLKCILLVPNFALDSAVVEVKLHQLYIRI